MPFLFDPFFSRKPDGVGMGLFVAKKIILAHRGDIRVENGAEGGAWATIRLPLAGPSSA